jgi:hypothetical protein
LEALPGENKQLRRNAGLPDIRQVMIFPSVRNVLPVICIFHAAKKNSLHEEVMLRTNSPTDKPMVSRINDLEVV